MSAPVSSSIPPAGSSTWSPTWSSTWSSTWSPIWRSLAVLSSSTHHYWRYIQRRQEDGNSPELLKHNLLILLLFLWIDAVALQSEHFLSLAYWSSILLPLLGFYLLNHFYGFVWFLLSLINVFFIFALSVFEVSQQSEIHNQQPAPSQIIVVLLAWTLGGFFLSHAIERRYHQRLRGWQRENYEIYLAQEAVLQADTVKERFLANMTEDILAPMSAIDRAVLFIDGVPLQDADSLEALVTLQKSTCTLREVLRDVADLAALDANRLQFCEVLFDWRSLAEDIGAAFSEAAVMKGLQFHISIHEIPNAPSVILGDPLRLRQILEKILDNAIKFTMHGSVHFEVSWQNTPTHRGLAYLIADTGIGIDAAYLEHIFLPFSQVDNSLTRRFGGTGIGLSLAKRLTDAMGGNLHLQSALGVGTQVYLDVPCEQKQQQNSADTPDTFEASLLGRRIHVAA